MLYKVTERDRLEAQVKQDLWEREYMNPTLRRIIEEAGLDIIDSDDDPVLDNKDTPPAEMPPEEVPEGDGALNLEQIAADFQQGNLTEEDLMKLYQGGQISKEMIQQIMGMTTGSEEPQSEEELLAQQVTQTNDMFIKFALYDKITDLTEKLSHFKENFDDIQSSIYERVLQLSEMLNILSSLIFNIETPISYQMYGSILLQLTELFDEYSKTQNAQIAQEEMKDKINSSDDKLEDVV